MVLNYGLYVGKTIRVFPSRLFVAVLSILIIYVVFKLTISTKPNDQFDSHISKKPINNDKKKFLEILLNKKPEINETFGKELVDIFGDFLESIDSKINQLEGRIKELESIINEKTRLNQEKNAKELGEKESIDDPQCKISSFEGFSSCSTKLQWMKKRWDSDPCYKEWGVDGSTCSIVKYLSEVEKWCPRIPGASKSPTFFTQNFNSSRLKMRDSFDDLNAIFDQDSHFKWISQRVKRMESKWLEAARNLSAKPYSTKWKQKKIFIHLGLLSEENGWNIAQNAFKGGPLGELVQWADVISSLYMLGHDITLSSSSSKVVSQLSSYFASLKSPNCPIKNHLYDIIYTDIYGLKTFKKISGQKFHLIQCRMRIVDSFGTEPEFNHPSYANRKKKKSEWGKLNFFPKQFNTMFPHTPDNTFLGFVIETADNASSTVTKRNIAVVYGKRNSFWEGKKNYLDVISEEMEIHATVSKEEEHGNIPPYVINHGFLPGDQLHELLRSAKIFVGLGFPYEGPAPLEAIADGAVFLNPVFQEGSVLFQAADKFFKKKPTSRRLTSQHPYAQNFVGEPHVRMVRIDNGDEVRNVVRDILSKEPVKGYLPYEFTCSGMLERIGFLVEEQEFCDDQKSWPPLSAMQLIVTDATQTCVEACMERKLICEPHFFPDINQRLTFKIINVTCDSFESPKFTAEEIDFPSYKDNKCFIQGNQKLFSCAGRHTNSRRLCPCRDYMKEQVALCKHCFYQQ